MNSIKKIQYETQKIISIYRVSKFRVINIYVADTYKWKNKIKRKSTIYPTSVVAIMSVIVLIMQQGFLSVSALSTTATGLYASSSFNHGGADNNWAVTGGTPTNGGSCSNNAHHCNYLDSNDTGTGTYLSTGTGMNTTTAEEEFEIQNYTSAGTFQQITGVTVYIDAVRNGACLGNGGNCDSLNVRIYSGGAYNGTTRTITGSTATPASGLLTTTSTESTLSWTGLTSTNQDDLRVEITRAVVGGGSASGADDDVRISEVRVDITYDYSIAPDYDQTAFRWYGNNNSVDVGAPLASLNTSANAPAEGTPFRLRMLIKITNINLGLNEASLKLQYAERGADNSCDVSFVNETYQDLEPDSGPIRFYNNVSPDDNDPITSNIEDPTNSPDTVVDQSYEEENGFTNSAAALSQNENGNWDFTLVDYSAPAQTTYCFRAVESSGAELNNYSQIPQITTSQPNIHTIALNAGPTSGGTPFTITGSKFEAGATVTIGGVAATKVFTVDDSTITGVAGAGSAGSQSVVVTNPSGSSTAQLSGFTHSNSLGIESKSVGTDFTAGSLTNMLTGGLKINDNLFMWMNLTASASGGSMSTGTYYYVATALDANGNETEKSVETKGIAVTGSSGSVSLTWRPIQGAHGYKIYRTTSSGTYSSPSLITTISATNSSTINSTISYTDTAASTSSGAPPASNNTTAGMRFSLGTVPNSGNGTYSAGPNLPGSIRGGSHSIQRPNGDFLVIRGHATNSTYNYTYSTNSFAFGPTLSGVANFGAHSIERPDGTFLIYSAGGTAVTTIYDPVANTMTLGPTAPVNLGGGANSFSRGDGTFLTIAGNTSSNTIIYDPVANSFTTGPTVVGSASNNVINGAHSYKRPDGKYFVITCTTASTTIYDPALNSFSAGPALTTPCDDGTVSIVRPNGMLLIIIGHDSPNPTGSTTTNNYDPYTNTITNGPTLPLGATQGTTPLQRPDGKYTVVHGGDGVANGSTYDPVANTFTSGPTPSAYVYEGGHAFQRIDGKYLILRGHSNTTSIIYDAGWNVGNTGDSGMVGVWESEDLNPGTLTSWEKIGFVKTQGGHIQATTSDRVMTSISDGGISTGQHSSIAIGADNLPIISYYYQTGGDLGVYKCSNASCSSGTNVTISDAGGDVWGLWTSIEIGSDGYPVISHYNSTDTDLAVTKCSDANCTTNSTTKFADADNVGQYSSLEIGADNLPIIASYNATDTDLMISQCTNINCTAFTGGGSGRQLTDAGTANGDYTSMTIGSDDIPIIAHRHGTTTDLAVTKCPTASCSTATSANTRVVTDADNTGFDTSIAIDPNTGYPVVAHFNNTSFDPEITVCANSSCSSITTSTTLIDSSKVYGLWNSLAFGTDDLPVFSSWRNETGTTNDSLIITKCGNLSCSSGNTITEFSTGQVAEYTSLIIAPDGLPFVSFWDYNVGADNDLAVLKCADITCSLSSNDTTGQIEVKTATTSGGLATAAYRKVSNGDSIGAGVGEVWLKIKITFRRDVPNWSESLAYSDNSAGGGNVWNCERAYGRYFAMPTLESVTASYNTAGGGGSAPTEDQFMRHGSYFSGGIEQPYYLD